MSNRADSTTTAFERKTIRKLRARIIPFIFVLYIVAFLDRTNIAVAKLTMNGELGVTATQYGLLSGIFFVGYFLLEVPSNLLLHRVGARVWIARILVTWGIVAMIGGLVQSVHQLYVVRFLLGVAEAGFAPGMLLYSPARTGACGRSLPRCHSGRWYYRLTGFGNHLGSRALDWSQQLALASDPGRIPGGSTRNRHVHRAAEWA
jgi:hypothetical protein